MATTGPETLQVVEDADTGHRFVVYAAKDGMRLELRFEGEEPWFTQAQLAEIFWVDVSVINRHISNFADDGEFDTSTIAEFAIVRSEGGWQVTRQVKHYGLDVAFYVGYRVNSRQGQLFRRWATNALAQLTAERFIRSPDIEMPERGNRSCRTRPYLATV